MTTRFEAALVPLSVVVGVRSGGGADEILRRPVSAS
jgi:hypothetical protein